MQCMHCSVCTLCSVLYTTLYRLFLNNNKIKHDNHLVVYKEENQDEKEEWVVSGVGWGDEDSTGHRHTKM